MKSSKSKKIVDFVLRVLGLLKWLPLGKYKPIILAISAVLGTVSGMLDKCESTPTEDDLPTTSTPARTPDPSPEPTSIRTPSPSPTPVPTIVVDRVPEVGWPFTVRYTAPFAYNTYLWIDKYKLQIMGQEYKTGYMIASAVVLNTGGKRRLTVRNLQSEVLAEMWIEVK